MKNKTNEKACCFYVSKNHLLVILISYLKDNLKEKENLTLFVEDDFEKEKKLILNTIEIKDFIKKKIIDKSWNNSYEENNIDKVDKNLTGIVIIQGSYEYIREINNKLKNNMKIKIINCYKFTDFKQNSKKILEKHGRIVNTTGEHEILDFFSKKIEKNPILTK